MRLPVLQGTIKRRLLVNFRADPTVVQAQLPAPFRPKTHRGYALVGICLIRLEGTRLRGLPAVLGISSENAAHRIAVEWTTPDGAPREGVYIPRRDTGSLLNRLAGGRLFPGEHHPARFSVTDHDHHIDLSMRSLDGRVSVQVVGRDTDLLPATSCFATLAESSAFFEGGSLGYSVTRAGEHLDGLTLRTFDWRLRTMTVTEARSTYFEDEQKFPRGTIEFDHALIMRDIRHEWHQSEDLPVGKR